MANERFVKLGTPVNADLAVKETRIVLTAADAHAKVLATVKWLPEHTETVRKLVDAIEARVPATAGVRQNTVEKTREEAKLRAQAKAFFHDLNNALARALPNTRTSKTMKDFQVGKVPDLTGPIVEKLERILGSLKELDPELTDFMKGKKPSETATTLLNALRAADQTQGTSMHASKAEMQQLRELKGQLVDMVRNLRRAADSAIGNDEAQLARYETTFDKPAKRKKAKAATPDPK